MSANRHALARAGWLAGAVAGAACVAAPGGALPPSLTAFALAITWGLLPGAWLARRLAGAQASDARAAFALLASPFTCGAVLAIARSAGVHPTFGAQAISAVLALLAAGEALRPAAYEGEETDTRAGWCVALGFGALVLLAHALHPALTERSDGSFHAGVVWAVERGLPPEDPFFAGLPLRYAWGLHAWAAGWLALSPRLDAHTPLVWANAGAAIAALLAVAALARRLGATPRATVLAQLLALVGASPFGWLALAGRAMRGEMRGAAELSRALEHGADTTFRALDPGWLHPSLVLPLDKFVVLTPFAWALAGGAVTLLAVAAWHDTRSRSALACVTLALAASIFAHPLAGFALVTACGFGVLLVASRPGEQRHPAGVLLAILAAAIAMLPYLGAIARPADAGSVTAGFAVSRAGLLSVIACGAIVLPLALRELAAGPRPDFVTRFMLGVLVALVLPALAVRLEGENQSKFLNVAFLLASAPAAVAWSRLARGLRRIAVLALVVAVAPTFAAALRAYAHESRSSADAPSRPPAAIVAAVEEWVPRDAIVVDATQDTTRGAAPALPAKTGRALLWSGGFMARKWGHPREALRARAQLAHTLEGGSPLPGVTAAIGGRDRELWLIVPETPARAADSRERVVARADSVLLIRRLPD